MNSKLDYFFVSIKTVLSGKRRIFLAYWLTPLCGALFMTIYHFFVLIYVDVFTDREVSYLKSLSIDSDFLILITLVVYFIHIFMIPLYVLYLKKRWFKLREIILGAYIISIVINILFSITGLGLSAFSLDYLKYMFFSMITIFGIGYAILFWFLGVYRNPWVKENAAR